MSSQVNRRNFLGLGLKLAAAVGVANVVGKAHAEGRKPRGGGAKSDDPCSLPMAEPDKGMPKSVNYQHDKSKVTDAKLKIERMGTTFKDQFCHNCAQYSEVKGCKSGKSGTCSIFANPKLLVKADGWCATWVKKA